MVCEFYLKVVSKKKKKIGWGILVNNVRKESKTRALTRSTHPNNSGFIKALKVKST